MNMTKCVFSLAAVFVVAPLFAATYYVSPTGSPEASGTESDPLDLATGIEKCYSYSHDELRFLPGTYMCGNPNNTYWQIIGGDTTFTGWGATRDDVILDYEGAGRTFRITNGRVSNLVITNFNCGSGTAAVNVFGGGILSNCVVTCGRSYGVNPAIEAALVVDCEISHIDGVGATYGAAIGNNSADARGKIVRCFVHDNVYPGNSTGGAGGYLKYGEVNSCVFSNNISAAWGGGLLVVNSVRILNSTFYENSSASVGGGAISMSSNCLLDNCTFVQNSCTGSGGALYCPTATGVAVRNCLFNHNATWREAADADIDSVTVKSTCVFSSASNQNCFNAENGNLVVADPLFVDAAQGNYRLQRKSPCVNKGLPLDWITADARDLDGGPKNPRLVGAFVDLGCYEYQPVLFGSCIYLR
ncbi:MAG: hypothetical protein PHV28_09385 [Kiritimatiellae bacterium]|nr:hypothetical protein [Kiritimatiellia bacterium]